MPESPAAESQADSKQQPQAGTAEPQAGEAQEPQGSESISVEEAKKLRSEAAALRRRTKEAEAELDRVKAQSMSEQEREVAKAKAEGLAEGLRRANVQLVRSEIKAAAAGRFNDPSGVADLLDANRFLNDEGEIDTDAIIEAVDRLAAARGMTVGLADGGIRATPPAQVDMNELLRRAAKG